MTLILNFDFLSQKSKKVKLSVIFSVISFQISVFVNQINNLFSATSRLYQMVQFYLFEPSGGLYGCPLAMTNGAARTIEVNFFTHTWASFYVFEF